MSTPALTKGLLFELADAGVFERPISQAQIEALATYAKSKGKFGASLTCHGVTVIVLATGEHTHVVPAARIVERPIMLPSTPRQDSTKP